MPTANDIVPLIGLPVVRLTTAVSTLVLILAAVFLGRYSLRRWWATPEGVLMFGLVLEIFLFSLRAWILRTFRDFPGSEWISLGLFVVMAALLVFLNLVYDRAQRPHRALRDTDPPNPDPSRRDP